MDFLTTTLRDSRLGQWLDPTLPLMKRLRRAYLELEDSKSIPGFSLTLPGGQTHTFGSREPAFHLKVCNRQGLAALTSLDETRFCEAYMGGSVDIEGDLQALFGLRPLLSDRHPVQAFWFKMLHPLVFGQVKSDAKWIAEHYDEDPDFYGLFLDQRRCYSHGIFVDDQETLESAIERKLAFALDSVGAQPGQRVLDIGAGWGAMAEYGGQRGLQMTSLTISEPSERFVNELIAHQNLPCQVVRQHFLEHTAPAYDAIVNLGVTEHLPDYAATLRQYQRLLKPGGRVYLDACAARRKFPFSSFIYRYIFPGNATPLCLHEYLAEVAETPFELIAVHDDRHSYELTCLHWARRLGQNKDEIVRRWGKSLYRRFQLYLWGCVDVFRSGKCEAYRLILELPDR